MFALLTLGLCSHHAAIRRSHERGEGGGGRSWCHGAPDGGQHPPKRGIRPLETRGDRIVRENYSPSGAARYLVKDLGFAATVAQSTDTHTVLLPVLKAAFEELTERGYGDQDIAVTRRYVAQR